MVGDELGGRDSGIWVTFKISTGIVSVESPTTLAIAGPAMIFIKRKFKLMKGCKHARQIQCRMSKNKGWVNLDLKLWNPHPASSLAFGVSRSDDLNLTIAACKRVFFSRILREEENEAYMSYSYLILNPSTKTLLSIIWGFECTRPTQL